VILQSVTLASYYLPINRLMSQKKVVINIGVKCCSTRIHHAPHCKTQILWPTGLRLYTFIIIFTSFSLCN